MFHIIAEMDCRNIRSLPECEADKPYLSFQHLGHIRNALAYIAMQTYFQDNFAYTFGQLPEDIPTPGHKRPVLAGA